MTYNAVIIILKILYKYIPLNRNEVGDKKNWRR